MIEVIVVACMGLNCRDFSLTFSDISLLQCQIGIGTQIEIAKWKQSHPNWRIAKHHCQVAGTFAKL